MPAIVRCTLLSDHTVSVRDHVLLIVPCSGPPAAACVHLSVRAALAVVVVVDRFGNFPDLTKPPITAHCKGAQPRTRLRSFEPGTRIFPPRPCHPSPSLNMSSTTVWESAILPVPLPDVWALVRNLDFAAMFPSKVTSSGLLSGVAFDQGERVCVRMWVCMCACAGCARTVPGGRPHPCTPLGSGQRARGAVSGRDVASEAGGAVGCAPSFPAMQCWL